MWKMHAFSSLIEMGSHKGQHFRYITSTICKKGKERQELLEKEHLFYRNDLLYIVGTDHLYFAHSMTIVGFKLKDCISLK